MISQKVIFSYSSRLLIQIVQILVGIVVARYIGPSVLGILSYSLAFVSMFLFITDLGLGTAFVKLRSDVSVPFLDLVKTFYRVKIVLIIIFAVCALIAIYWHHYDSTISLAQNLNNESLQILLIYVIITVFGAFYSIQTTYWASEMKQVYAELPALLQQLLYQILRLLIVVLGYSALGISLMNLVAVCAILPLYIYFGKTIQMGSFSYGIMKKLLIVLSPVIFIGIMQVLIYSTDKVVLRELSGEFSVGLYAASSALANFLKAIEGVLGMLFFTFISSFWHEQKLEDLARILDKFLLIVFSFITPFVVLIMIVADRIIMIVYGNKFGDAVGSFRWLLMAFLIGIASLPFGNILFAASKFAFSAKVWFMGFLIFLISAYLLIHPSVFNMGDTGASIAIFFANILIGFLFLIKASDLIGYKYWKFFKLLMFNLAMAIVGIILYLSFRSSLGSLLLIFCCLFYLAFFFFVGFISGIIEGSSVTLIRNAISPKRMKEYISSEMKS